MKNKKLLTIVGILVFIIIVIIFALNQKRTTSPTTSPTITPTITSIKPVLDEKTYYPTLSGDNLIYLAGTAQELRQISLVDKNQKAIIYPVDVPFVENINWSPDKSKAIIKTLDQTKNETQFYLYDFNAKKLLPLNTAIAATAKWGEDSSKLFYCQTDGNSYSFDEFDFTANISKKILDLPERCDKAVAYQPDKQALVYAIMKSDVSADLNLFNPQTKQKSTLVSNDYLDAKSLNSNWVIIRLNQDKNNIIAYGLENKVKKDLNLTSNLDKIVLSGTNEIIAAVKENNTDVFYRINLETGAKKKIANQPSGTIDAQNLNISPDGKTLYFTNDDYLYQIEL